MAGMDLCLVVGMTYRYHMMQTQVLVAAISATPISAHQDNRALSSQVKKVSLSQITRCLDSPSDNYQQNRWNKLLQLKYSMLFPNVVT